MPEHGEGTAGEGSTTTRVDDATPAPFPHPDSPPGTPPPRRAGGASGANSSPPHANPASPASPQPMSTSSAHSSPAACASPPSPASSASPTSPPCKVRLTMVYPKDPDTTLKWKAMEDRVEAAELLARQQQQDASDWRGKHRRAKADIKALGERRVTAARELKRAVSAARGATKLELEKLKSAYHDARRVLDRENYECTYRKRMDRLAAEQRAELANMKLKLAESEAQQVALSTRFGQLESRAAHSKEQVARMTAAAVASGQREAAAATVEAELESELAEVEGERKQGLRSMTQLQCQLKESERQLEKTQARLELVVEEQLLVTSLPAIRNWDGVKPTAAAVYRTREVNALVKLLESRLWRAEDISRALALACFKDTAEPVYLSVFNQCEFWGLRLGWMRSVHQDLETEGKWGPGLVVKLHVAGPFSERQIDMLHHETGGDYHADIDRHKRAPLLTNPFDETDIVMVPRPFACRWRWVPPFQAAKRALNVETDETGTIAIRPFLTLAIELYRHDRASASISDLVGRSADCPLVLTLMLDGFPLEKQSIEHLCLSNASLSDGVALHSEAALRCGVIAGMKETNESFERLFEAPGVGADLNAIASGSVCLPCDEGDTTDTLHTVLNVGADRKAIENMRGCGPCSPWCRDCGRAVQHLLPWTRGAHPPATMQEYRLRKRNLVQVVGKDGKRKWIGCSTSFFTNPELREAGHVAQKGEALPRFCRSGQSSRTLPHPC